LIGDKRNDENVIVSQLHAAMLQFHNKLVDSDPTILSRYSTFTASTSDSVNFGAVNAFHHTDPSSSAGCNGSAHQRNVLEGLIGISPLMWIFE
jgi:hypothetical protein